MARAHKFLQVCIEGTVTTTAVEDDMKEMISLSEDFVVCDALDGKWSSVCCSEVRHKCT